MYFALIVLQFPQALDDPYWPYRLDDDIVDDRELMGCLHRAVCDADTLPGSPRSLPETAQLGKPHATQLDNGSSFPTLGKNADLHVVIWL